VAPEKQPDDGLPPLMIEGAPEVASALAYRGKPRCILVLFRLPLAATAPWPAVPACRGTNPFQFGLFC